MLGEVCPIVTSLFLIHVCDIPTLTIHGLYYYILLSDDIASSVVLRAASYRKIIERWAILTMNISSHTHTTTNIPVTCSLCISQWSLSDDGSIKSLMTTYVVYVCHEEGYHEKIIIYSTIIESRLE